jgi:hypothetical protein
VKLLTRLRRTGRHRGPRSGYRTAYDRHRDAYVATLSEEVARLTNELHRVTSHRDQLSELLRACQGFNVRPIAGTGRVSPTEVTLELPRPRPVLELLRQGRSATAPKEQ